MAYIGAGISRFNTADELTVTGDAQIDGTTLVIDSTNNRVGIGTSSPSTLLHLDASADGRVARFGSGTSDTGGMYVTHNSGSTRSFEVSADNILILDADRSNGRGSSRLQFNVDGSERLRIDSSGNVGIGTSSPSSKFVVSDGGAYGFEFLPNNSSLNQVLSYDRTASVYRDYKVSASQIIFGYGQTGANEAMRIDSSGNVGIGTSSPAATSSTYKNLQVGVGATVIGRTDDTPLYLSSNLSYNSGWKYIANTTATQIALGTNIQFFNVPSGTAGNAATLTERMRVDSSGNLLVGTTDPLVGSGTGNNTEGIALSAGSYGGYAAFSRSGSECLNLNRKTNDGTILNFRKDGTTVGSIGTEGNDLAIGNDDAGLQFVNNTQTVRPFNMSTNTRLDNAIDLGMSNTRFKDLYLSGGVYLGGTGSANKLDDYEEGTFTASLGDDSTTAGSATGNYTKVGNQVFIKVSIGNVNTSSLTGSEDLRINGLPFTPVEVNFRGAGVASLDGVSFSGYITSEISGGAYIKLVENASGASGDRIIVSQYTSGSADIWISLVYTTNS